MFLGLGGIVIPILPGLTLQVAAVILWAVAEGSPMGWVVAGVSVVVAGIATVLKFTRPGKRLREAGVPTRLLAVAGAAALVGFFVVPVAGAVLGFVLALYVFERARIGRERAWPSTKTALIAIAQAIGIELAGGLLILVVFVAAVFLT